MRISMIVTAAVAAAAAAAAVAGPTSADNPQLVGTVGPGFTIDLADAGGAHVTHLDPGTYTLVVHDRAEIHDFHLFGPGDVNASTGVDSTGDDTFTVTLVDGTYSYVCDPHSSQMMGTFTVGNAPAPKTEPKATRKLAALRIGPGRSIVAPKKLAAGAYTVTVADNSAKDNIHLVGPGVNRKTSLAFRGTVRWNVTLSSGRYRVFSDAHPKVARAVVVP